MDPAEWKAGPGRVLREARTQARLSKRAAARLADLSESMWRQLEEGQRHINAEVVVPINPRDETLERAARAVHADVRKLFGAAGRDYSGSVLPPSGPDEPPWDTLLSAMRDLTDGFRDLRDDLAEGRRDA